MRSAAACGFVFALSFGALAQEGGGGFAAPTGPATAPGSAPATAPGAAPSVQTPTITNQSAPQAPQQLTPELLRQLQQQAPQRETAAPREALASTEAPERNEFQDFIAVSTGQRLPLYGYNLFAGAPSTFAPADNIPVTGDYVIGPADELLIRAWGQIDVDYRAVV